MICEQPTFVLHGKAAVVRSADMIAFACSYQSAFVLRSKRFFGRLYNRRCAYSGSNRKV